MGVLLAHANSSYSGKLYRKNSSDSYVMSNKTMTISELKTSVSNKFTNSPGEGTTDGGEAGLYALNKLLNNNIQATKGLGFFREDAALAVVFVSDENDICYPGVVVDGQHFRGSSLYQPLQWN